MNRRTSRGKGRRLYGKKTNEQPKKNYNNNDNNNNNNKRREEKKKMKKKIKKKKDLFRQSKPTHPVGCDDSLRDNVKMIVMG